MSRGSTELLSREVGVEGRVDPLVGERKVGSKVRKRYTTSEYLESGVVLEVPFHQTKPETKKRVYLVDEDLDRL